MAEIQAKARIFIIEDEALVARELKSRLTSLGFDVVGVAYGARGLRAAIDAAPDLLLTDINLRDGDGIELARQINAEHPVPVVFLTAYSDPDTVSRAKLVAPYGYIIKPAENRELEIAIEMALYKFKAENELKETQALLSNALTCLGDALVFVEDTGRVTNINSRACELLGTNLQVAQTQNWHALLGLQPDSSARQSISNALADHKVTRFDPILINRVGGGQRMVDGLVGTMDSGGVLMLRELSEVHDAPEPPPSRDEVLQRLGSELRLPVESSIVELLIAPDREPGAATLDAIEQTLRQTMRSTDLVSRYGNAVFSASLPFTTADEGGNIAGQILKNLAMRAFDAGPAGALTFSIGMAHSEPGNQQPLELFTDALRALNVARDAGGNQVMASGQVASAPEVVEQGRHYQNLLLLWNVMNVIAKSSDVGLLNDRICEHIVNSFQLRGAAFLVRGETGLESLSESPLELSGLGFGEAEFIAVTRLFEQGGAGEHPAGDTHLFTLELGSRPVVLFLSGCSDMQETDLTFLRTLLDYYSSAVAGLADGLVEERGDVADGGMVYGSTSMHAVVQAAADVAKTEETVLITGESGTGKELIARSIHALSQRGDRPFVVVDCGSIPPTLIESELFGHVRGAFTGADKSSEGRLCEAHGGTILLDEIGELPMDIQVKLLRFVQERQVHPVGGTGYRTIDTRIISATNRDLGALVEQGRFRGDLYYRLNVLPIHAPALRDREDDVMLLAHHYLQRVASRYGKPILGFAEDAQVALRSYSWPGNVRELINFVTRSVILCNDTHVSTIHLGLFPEKQALRVLRQDADSGSRLAGALAAAITCCVQNAVYPPIGQWLEDDIISVTLDASRQVLAQAAERLQMPETTLRRKSTRIRNEAASRPEYWSGVTAALPEFVGAMAYGVPPACDIATRLLLKEILREAPGRSESAQLMGVSAPTLRRMLR